MSRIPTEDPQNIPEVAAYEQAKRMLEAFKANNQLVINRYQEFVQHYNQTKQAAESAVRARGVKCGDFDLYQLVQRVKGEEVLNAVSREVFLQIGGTIITKREAKISPKSLQTALARGLISQELYDEVVHDEPRYHVPDDGVVV